MSKRSDTSDKFWPEQAIKWYNDACTAFNYPETPYGDGIRSVIHKDDTVMDLGCGIGAALPIISPTCKRVIAVDKDREGLMAAQEAAADKGLTNVEFVQSNFPSDTLPAADVVVALHVLGVAKELTTISRLLALAKKGGVIGCNAPAYFAGESFSELRAALGQKAPHNRCDNGCYTRGVLEALGCQVSCKRFTYDFGQPLLTRDEVVDFILWQVREGKQAASLVEQFMDRYITRENGKYIVHITRNSCCIVFRK